MQRGENRERLQNPGRNMATQCMSNPRSCYIRDCGRLLLVCKDVEGELNGEDGAGCDVRMKLIMCAPMRKNG